MLKNNIKKTNIDQVVNNCNLNLKKGNIMSNLLLVKQDGETKNVKLLNGMSTTAIKIEDEIYVPLSEIGRNLGFDKVNAKHFNSRIKNDNVFNEFVRGAKIYTPGGLQTTTVINIKALPLALAKITLTDNLKSKFPNLVENVLFFQLKAMTILANAFIPNSKPLPINYKEALIELVKAEEHRELVEKENLQLIEVNEKQKVKLDNMIDYYNKVFASKSEIGWREVARQLRFAINGEEITSRNELLKILRDNKFLMKSKASYNTPYQKHFSHNRFKIVTKPIENSNGRVIKNVITTYITQEGLAYLHNWMLKNIDGIEWIKDETDINTLF